RWLPCSPACANWLRYGFQPANAGPGLAPGRCLSPAHERENLGLGGRRVLVSRAWSGKTLADHRADRRAVVTQVLEAAGIPTEDAARLATHHRMPDGQPRYVWTDVPAAEQDYVSVMIGCIRHARQRREQYETAKAQLSRHEPPRGGPVDNRSTTHPAA
ncbi:MAG: replication initiator, partial [Dermatophilaceae bacterium]